MKLKFFYNTLLTLGIALMLLSAVSSYQAEQYLYLAISLALIVVLGWLKYKLLADVKNTIKTKK